MKRREFITLFSGAAAWSSVAQSATKRPIIGTFVQGTPTQNKGLRFRQSFFDGLRELEYIEGRDFDITIQHAGSTSELPKAAEKLVQVSPNVILAAASATRGAAFAARPRRRGDRMRRREFITLLRSLTRPLAPEQ